MQEGVSSVKKKYNLKLLSADGLAGLTVAVILVPQGMAYALLAGLPPVYGLYGALVPLLIYSLFSSSREMSIGPVALMSIIILSGVSVFAEPGSQEYIDLVLMTAVISGFIQIAFSVLKLGIMANFLSKPVMSGFISAAGVIIGLSQLKYLLGLSLPRSNSVMEMLKQVFNHIGETNVFALGFGLIAIALIMLMQKIHKAIPSALIVVGIGSALLYYFNLESKEGISIVGHLPKGLPMPTIGFWHWDKLVELLPTSFIISIVCFIGSFSISKTLAAKKGDYPILPNQELRALGLAKVIGSFFLAMPSTGSFTRSAINAKAGAQTRIANLIAAIFVALTLLFFGQLFYYLPEPILAAIVITSVIGLINFKDARYLYYTDKSDFYIFNLTFLFTLILGIVNGILLGIVISMISIIVRAAKPHYALLGLLPNTDTYRNIERFPNAKIIPNTVILRYDQDLFFGNAEHFYNSIINEIKANQDTKKLILNMSSFHSIDSTSLYKLNQLIKYCKKQNIRLVFTDINGPVRDLFYKVGIFEKLGAVNFHLTVADAVADHSMDEDLNLSNTYSNQVSEEIVDHIFLQKNWE